MVYVSILGGHLTQHGPCCHLQQVQHTTCQVPSARAQSHLTQQLCRSPCFSPLGLRFQTLMQPSSLSPLYRHFSLILAVLARLRPLCIVEGYTEQKRFPVKRGNISKCISEMKLPQVKSGIMGTVYCTNRYIHG